MTHRLLLSASLACIFLGLSCAFVPASRGPRALPPSILMPHVCRRTATSSMQLSATGIKVGIAGAGAVAFGSAARLVENSHDPMLWSPSGAGTSELLSGAPLCATGAIQSTMHPRIASTPQELVEENDVIFLALPANGHIYVMNAIAPYLRPGQIVIISSHSSLGALYLGQLLAERKMQGVPIVAWGTTAITARRPSACEVQVCTIRTQVDMVTVPTSASKDGLELCKCLFGDVFRQRDGLMAISLSNLNAQNHLAIALCNMSRMERGETWSQGLNITPNIGRFMEALDDERLAIADAVGVQVRTVREHFSLSFHVPLASVYEMNQEMVKLGNDVNGPPTPDSRYVTEDVPFGLTLIVELGRMCGRPAILHEAGIRIVSALYGREFEKENELLNALELRSRTIRDIVVAGDSGVMGKQR